MKRNNTKPAVRKIKVNDLMQSGYEYCLTEPEGKNFDPEFKPELTPARMLEMGVFGGKYLTDCTAGFTRTIHGDGFNGIAATIWGGATRMTSARSGAGKTCSDTSANSVRIAYAATCCVVRVKDRRCYNGLTIHIIIKGWTYP
ncbi:MAG: hypothetical protein OQJ84_10275 [Xanthomonadales bacterium]|nr:hypothetical protein [Xanthomonadales bacterium]